MSHCGDLIGVPYRLGSDGSDGSIDCIHLCYRVLERVGIEAPEFKESWYEASKWTICRDLMRWGVRVEKPAYDGDILLLRQQSKAFAVTWQTGILYINPHIEKVAWASAQFFQGQPCFRSRSS